jgi:hypothetical protein
MRFTATLEQLKALETAGIIEFRGFSGVKTTAETAIAASPMCLAHSLSGKTFDIWPNVKRDGVILLTEYK